MRISLVGPLELVDEAVSAVTLASRRQRQLLTALAMNRNQPIDVDSINELVWESTSLILWGGYTSS